MLSFFRIRLCFFLSVQTCSFYGTTFMSLSLLTVLQSKASVQRSNGEITNPWIVTSNPSVFLCPPPSARSVGLVLHNCISARRPMALLVSGLVMQSVEHTGLCCLQYGQWVGMQGQCIDLSYPFIELEGGPLMSGKVEQTSLITETLLEVVVVQLVALVRW